MRTVILENKHLRVTSLPDKGSDIIEVLYTARGLEDRVRRGNAAKLEGRSTIETEMKALTFEETVMWKL